MVIADASSRVDFAAADLLAQAEHGSGREKIYLVSQSSRVIDQIEAEVAKQLELISRADKTRRVLKDGFLSVKVASFAEAVAVANYVSPEHLELLLEDAEAKKFTKAITTAGAIMIGNYTPTSWVILPQVRAMCCRREGRDASLADCGLRILCVAQVSLPTTRGASRRGEKIVAKFAAMERLDAHGKSATIRLKR